MTTNGKYKELLKAEKKSVFTKRNIIFYSIIVLSVILMISFFSSLGFSDIGSHYIKNYTYTNISELPSAYEFALDSYVFGTTTPEGQETKTVAFSAADGILITLPIWGVGALITSCIGFGSTILGSTFSKTMLLENKDWLKLWSKKGKITSYYMFKRVKIDLGENYISILKLKNKYRFKIPKTKGLDLTKYGFRVKNNYYLGYFVKEELTSIIHLLTSQM